MYSCLIVGALLAGQPISAALAGQPSPRLRAIHVRAGGCAMCAERPPWRAEEDWALLDEAPSFTAGESANAVTFWTALAASNAALAQRTAVECERRMTELAAQQRAPSSFGGEPRKLDSWERLADGRYTGTYGGRTVWLTVEAEGRLASDPRPGAGYVESLGGVIYELGTAAADSGAAPRLAEAGVEDGGAGVAWAERWNPLRAGADQIERSRFSPLATAAGVRAMALAAAVSTVGVGAAGFFLGAQSVPPPPAPRVTAVMYRNLPAGGVGNFGLAGTSGGYGGAEQAGLTISEQKARQVWLYNHRVTTTI